MVPRRGLEPPRLAAPVPETGASTNSAIWAYDWTDRSGASADQGAQITANRYQCQWDLHVFAIAEPPVPEECPISCFQHRAMSDKCRAMSAPAGSSPERNKHSFESASNVPMPKLVIPCDKLRTSFGIDKVTSKIMIPVRFSDLKFATSLAQARSELQIHHTRVCTHQRLR